MPPHVVIVRSPQPIPGPGAGPCANDCARTLALNAWRKEASPKSTSPVRNLNLGKSGEVNRYRKIISKQ